MASCIRLLAAQLAVLARLHWPMRGCIHNPTPCTKLDKAAVQAEVLAAKTAPAGSWSLRQAGRGGQANLDQAVQAERLRMTTPARAQTAASVLAGEGVELTHRILIAATQPAAGMAAQVMSWLSSTTPTQLSSTPVTAHWSSG